MNQSMVDMTIPWVCLITSLVLPRFHLGLTCWWIWVIWIRLMLQPLRGRFPLRFHASQGWWLTLNLSKNLTQINLSHNHLTSQIISTHCEQLSFPSVQKLRFSGQLNEQLDIFDLSGNPKLSTFSNNFNVSLKLNVIRQLRNLLNHNGTNSLLSSFPQISRLEVTSTKLKTFPDFLRNEFKLSIWDLSDIQTHGKRVNWIWKLNNLLCLEISYNYLVTLEGPLLHICSFECHSHRPLQAQLVPLSPSATYLCFLDPTNYYYLVSLYNTERRGIPQLTKLSGNRSQLIEETHSTSGIVIDWNYIIAELGFIFGLGIIYWPLLFSKKWRIWYFKHVDDLLFWMFPQLYLGKEYRRRRAHRNKERRH